MNQNDRSFALVSGDFVETGGMDRANHAVARYLAQRGDHLHLVAYRVADDLRAFSNVEFHRVGKVANSYLLSHPILSRQGSRIARQITQRFPKARVIVNGGNCRWHDVNWLHHLNVLDHPPRLGFGPRSIHRELAYRLYRREDRRALASAKLVITTCERNKQDLSRWLNIPDDRVRVIYYGSDPQRFRPCLESERGPERARLGLPVDRSLFAFVGGLGDRRKGFDTLFSAWCELVRKSSWDADLVVIGAGSELGAWKDRARAANLDKRIHFFGFRRDVAEILRVCDAHVLPSRYEGYSLATQEALLSGLPALVTETAGIAERYPDALRDALLIRDADDASALAKQMRGMRDQLQKESLVKPLREFAEMLRQWTWPDMARAVVECVESFSP